MVRFSETTALSLYALTTHTSVWSVTIAAGEETRREVTVCLHVMIYNKYLSVLKTIYTHRVGVRCSTEDAYFPLFSLNEKAN